MNNRNQVQDFHSVDIMQIDNITESLTSMFADLSLHFVRSNRFHAGKGNNNLLINDDWYEYKRGYSSVKGRITNCEFARLHSHAPNS